MTFLDFPRYSGYICYIVHTSSYQQKLVTLRKLLGLYQTVWPQSKSCSCYLEILMKIQRNLGSAAVNVFDTQIEMPPLHESVSRSIAAKYIRMTFRIQQAENKPKFFLSRPKFMAKPAYRSSNVTLRTAISRRHLLYYSLHYCGGRAVHHNTGVRTYGQMGSADPPGKWMKN